MAGTRSDFGPGEYDNTVGSELLTEEKYKKYQPIHVDLYDTTLRQIVEASLNPALLKNHRVAELIRRPDKTNQWIVRLEYDFMKDSEERAKVQI
jgi:hypothetical protein